MTLYVTNMVVDIHVCLCGMYGVDKYAMCVLCLCLVHICKLCVLRTYIVYVPYNVCVMCRDSMYECA